jgi:Ion transport protein
MEIKSSYKISIKYTIDSGQKLDLRSEDTYQDIRFNKFSKKQLEKKISMEEEYQNLIQDETWAHPMIPMKKIFNERSFSNLSQFTEQVKTNISSDQSELKESQTQLSLELQNYLKVRIMTDIENVDNLIDNFPALEFRRAVIRIMKSFSELCYITINHFLFQWIVALAILLNTIIIAIEDPSATTLQSPYSEFELFFIYFYSIEFGIKICALGAFLNRDGYFRDPWNILDFIILLSMWISLVSSSKVTLNALRSLRVLRTLRNITAIKGMKAMILALINSIKPLISAFMILFFFIFIFAVAAVQLWMGELRRQCMSLETGIYLNNYQGLWMNVNGPCGAIQCPEFYICIEGLDNPNFGTTHYDNILISLVSVFQIMTLENWSINMMQTQMAFSYYCIFFYIPFVFIAAIIILNFTLAIITSAFDDASKIVFQSNGNEIEIVSDSIFQAIYNNTTKNFVGSEKRNLEKKFSDIGANKEEMIKSKSNKVFEEKKNKKKIENFHVEDEYELGVDDDDYFFRDEYFESSNIISRNTLTMKSVKNSNNIDTIIKKKTNENICSRLLFPQLSFNRDNMSVANIETNQILTDIHQDDPKKKTRAIYEKLKGSVTVLHKTLDVLRSDPSSIKRSRFELFENYKITSNSALEILSPPEKPQKINKYSFEYREPETPDRLTIYYEKRVLNTMKKFREYPTRFKVFNYLSLRMTRRYSFNLLTIPALNFTKEILEIDNNQGEWSGYDVMGRESDDLKYHRINLSKMNYRLWSKGKIGKWEMIAYPIMVFVTNKYTNYLILAAVIINTIALSMDHYRIDQQTYNNLQLINEFFTFFFITEIILKILGLGIKKFLRDFMNYLDTVVVCLSLMEILVIAGGSSAISAFRVIRVFRVFRIMKLFRYLKSMNHIIKLISKSFPNVIYVFLLLLLFLIIFTLLGMQLFGGAFNFSAATGGLPRQNFDTFHWAFVTTFQLLSTENWNNILTSSLRSTAGPASCLLLITWVILGNYILLNLFLAIMLENFSGDDAQDSILVIDGLKTANTKIQKKLRIIENFNDSESEISNQDANPRFTIFDKIECERSYYIFSKTNIIRIFFSKICNSPYFDYFILAVIMINCIKLVIDTYTYDLPTDSVGYVWSTDIDTIFTLVFGAEFLVKSISMGFIGDDLSYMSNNWNRLDFTVVVISVIDLIVSSINIPIIKAFRLLRVVRPLKLIKHNYTMKIVTMALIKSLVSLVNITIVILIIFLMYAILGVSLLSGKMHYCANSQLRDIDSCQNAGYEWVNTPANFDDVIQGSIILFIIMSQESWPNRMIEGVDSRGVGVSYVKNYNPYMAYYYCAFLFIANFFLLNLFAVIIFEKFNEAKRNESEIASIILTKEQLLWTDIQKMIITAKPVVEKVIPYSNFISAICLKIAKNKNFELIIIGIIFINMIALALPYHEASSAYISTLDSINLVCTCIFVSEACIKIIGLRTNYFFSHWNKFDFLVALLSFIDLILSYSLSANVPLLRQGPQLIRILRVLRVTRLFRLIKTLETLQQIIFIIAYTLPAIINVLSLMMIIFFMYAVLGSFLFHSITTGNDINEYYNFKNFNYAMTILWRISTGEDYPIIMWDIVIPLGSHLYVIYFLSFIFIIQFVVVELFVSIILQEYEEFVTNPYNSLSLFTKDIKLFRKLWIKDNPESNHNRIAREQLIELIRKIGKEFDFIPNDSKIDIMKIIGSMNIDMDNEGYFYFNDVLFAVMKKKYTKKLERKGKYNIKILRMQEIKTKKELNHIREKYIVDKDKAAKNRNFFLDVILLKGIFKNWKKYTKREKESQASITPQFSDVEYPGENSLLEE